MSSYVVLEGADGCGKSTQAARLASWLTEQGRDVLHLREPGSTTLGEGLRRVLLDPKSGDLSPFAEALLFTAARAELVTKVIAPALRSGKDIVSERCYLSTWVYQGLAAGGDGVPLSMLEELTARAHGDCWPDRIVVIDVPFAVGRERIGAEDPDRIEARSGDYFEGVCAGYRQLATSHDRCRLVDGALDESGVAEAVRSAVADLLVVS